MAIAYGTHVLASTSSTAAGNYTFSITPAAAPAAVCVMIVQGGATTDLVTSVDYGGVLLTRIRFDTEATEAGGCYIYWGKGLPSGTQTITIARTDTTSIRASASTMTVAAGQTVAVENSATGTSASVANPSWTLSTTAGVTTAVFECIHSGLQTMTTTPATGWTSIGTADDIGSTGRGWAFRTSLATGGSVTCGWTAGTADDFVGSSIAFKETAVVPITTTVNQAIETDSAQPIKIPTTINNTFDGISNGTTITTGNSGGTSGTAFDVVSGSAVSSTSNKYRGTAGATLTVGGTAGTVTLEHNAALRTYSSGGGLYGRAVMNLPALPTTNMRVAVVADSINGFQGEWRINTSGQIEVRSTGGVLETTSTSTITPGSYFRLEVAVISFGVGSGELAAKLFLDPTSSTPTETLTTLAGLDTFKSGGQNKARWGILTSTTNFEIRLDDVGWSNVGYLGSLGTPTAGSTNVAVGQVTETDTAQPIKAVKIKAVNQVTETDSTQTVTKRKLKTVGQISEADTAQTISKRKLKGVSQAVEVDSALVITKSGPKIVVVGQAVETDTAQPITRRKSKVVLQVTETDTPQTITKRKIKSVLQTTETDTAQTVTRQKRKAVLQVTETDTSNPVTKRKIKAVAQTVETDSAQIVLKTNGKIINQVTETDTAQPITRRKIKLVGQAVETDTTQSITRVHRRTLGQPVETDTVGAISKRKIKTVGQTLESDTANRISVEGKVAQVTETDIAQPITRIKRKTIGQPIETSTVQSIRRQKSRTVLQVTETSTATTITKRKKKLLSQVIETDVANTIVNKLPDPRVADVEVIVGGYVVTVTVDAVTKYVVDVTLSNSLVVDVPVSHPVLTVTVP